ncbi:MAG: hypothetical protein MUF50_01120 [Planctomycetes bacterium]|jgi:hypothetical protein|nr:hypothetical protein [Planctomycetota bacterium]
MIDHLKSKLRIIIKLSITSIIITLLGLLLYTCLNGEYFQIKEVRISAERQINIGDLPSFFSSYYFLIIFFVIGSIIWSTLLIILSFLGNRGRSRAAINYTLSWIIIGFIAGLIVGLANTIFEPLILIVLGLTWKLLAVIFLIFAIKDTSMKTMNDQAIAFAVGLGFGLISGTGLEIIIFYYLQNIIPAPFGISIVISIISTIIIGVIIKFLISILAVATYFGGHVIAVSLRKIIFSPRAKVVFEKVTNFFVS